MAGVLPLTLSVEEVTYLQEYAEPIVERAGGSRKGRSRRSGMKDGFRSLGSRRMRRFVNEMELRRSGGLDKEGGCDIRELFMVRWRGGFAEIFGAGADTREAFRNLTEEEQSKWLGQCGNNQKKTKATDSGIGKVDGRIKNVLQRRKFLVPVVQKVEERVRYMNPGGRLVLLLGNSVQRLAAHGVAQFYDMRHHSEDREGGKRVTIIQDRTLGERVLPKDRLADLIAA